jgi:nucleoside-diphosphate-sugar epimerase
MPRIAVIGSSGWLGSALVAALDAWEVRCVDIAARAGGDAQRGDVRLAEDMERAVDGVDAVIHLVAWHGGYHPAPTDEARFDTNVVGTFRVLQACLKKDVRRLVWASSIAAWSPASFYGATKVVGETLCRHHHLAHGFRVAMMRYGSFTPCDLVTYGQRLLANGVDRRDCCEATLAALRGVMEGRVDFGAYTVLAEHPFTPADCDGDPREAVARHWPGQEDLLDRYEVALPRSLVRHDLRATREALGWQGRHTFGTFLDALRRLDAAGAVRPDSPRWSFEQGTPPPESVVWPGQGRP